MANETHPPQFGVPQGFKADRRVVTVQEQLVKAGVKSCLATFVDVYGVPKAKVTPSFYAVSNEQRERYLTFI